MDDSTPIFLTGCERLGVFDFSPTSGGAGELVPAPQKELFIEAGHWKKNVPPQWVGPS